jgi:hypothetical protein
MRNNFPGFTLCTVLTPLLAFIVYFLVQYAENGSYIGLYIFPWAYIGSFFHIALPSIFLVLGFLQLPIYGLLFDNFKRKKSRLILLILICTSHLLLIKLITSQ